MCRLFSFADIELSTVPAHFTLCAVMLTVPMWPTAKMPASHRESNSATVRARSLVARRTVIRRPITSGRTVSNAVR